METSQLSNAEQAGQLSERLESAGRRTYGTPQLTRFGNLRGITLGGSPGAGDSGQQNQDPPMMFTEDYNAIP